MRSLLQFCSLSLSKEIVRVKSFDSGLQEQKLNGHGKRWRLEISLAALVSIFQVSNTGNKYHREYHRGFNGGIVILIIRGFTGFWNILICEQCHNLTEGGFLTQLICKCNSLGLRT